ncbi:hypothetical protein GGI07_005328 [Coemansia sp. Benny D115]|nr:hypothetical protein GGI07_005328 [Coemansia sp. Benny D115]
MPTTNILRKRHVEGDDGVVGGQLILLGSFLLWFAHRYQRIAIYASTYIAGSSLALLACQKIHPTPPGGGILRRILYTVVSMLCGLALMLVAAGVLSHRRWQQLARSLFGGLAGCAVGLYVLAMSDEGLVRTVGGRMALVLGGAAVAATAMTWAPRHAFGGCAATLGAYVLVLGIDCFAQTGYRQHVAVFAGVRSAGGYYAGREAMVLQAAALLLALASATWQRAWAAARVQRILRNNSICV